MLRATLLLIGEIIGAAKLSKEYEFFATDIHELEHTCVARRVASDAPH